MKYSRHTLIDISRQGRLRLFNEITGRGVAQAVIGQILLPEDFQLSDPTYRPAHRECSPVPGIVRRETGPVPDGYISVGLVSWESGTVGRLRLSAQIHEDEVERASSPQDVLAEHAAFFSRTPCLKALWHLKKQAYNWNMLVGCWGSTALELHTGYLYTHQGSDLDLFLQPKTASSRASLEVCLQAVLEAEQLFQLRIDAELALPSGYGIALKELMNDGNASVLGKGIHDVTLLQKTDILACFF